MSKIVFRDLGKRFGEVKAVDGLSLTIDEGDFVTLLGPSGCGKTTTLRCLSGLEEPDRGEIYIGDQCVFSASRKINVPAGQRRLGLVFQNYALWPHMKVSQNIAFGLRRSKLGRTVLEQRIAEILRIVGLEGFEERYPHELSGGQQQRVAVARMVVTEPAIFLFDEPLSNLDAKLRMRLRSELKRLHLDLGATTVYVTHDQVEAMALSDRIVVMKDGIIQQVGAPYEVYHFPANLFVADFMGNPQTNMFKGQISRRNGKIGLIFRDCPALNVELEECSGLSDGLPVTVNIRPEDIELMLSKRSAELFCLVYTTQPMGSEVLVHLKAVQTDLEIMVKGPEDQCRDLKPEMQVGVRMKRGNIFHGESGKLICSFGFDR
ncbi:MAG: ABC transporter ATP-binding protein [Spirochaetaceae bacterium]|nr:MAG: ABC transporter ATP-binding protein [Spirochaetaceae bacterium]